MGKLGPSSLGHIYREGRKQSLLRSVLGDLELRLKDGGHRCEGRVEVKHQEDWGTVNDYKWGLEEATVVCRQLGCGAAIDAPQGAHFGPAVGPIWYSVIYCRGTESAIMECSHSTVKDYRPDGLSHDQDAGAVCSGFVRLAGGEGPCSGRVEVHSGEDWTPVSDGNFTFPTAQVICAERGCGKVVSVLGHVPFRDSDGRVWAEEFRCEGEEPELWSCPRVPCPGGTCHHSGAVQVVCSENQSLLKRCFLLPMYTEVRLMTNGSSQCEGQVEMNISGRWRALCASHWSLANANVVCRQLGCGVAISTPRGPHYTEGGDQISTVRLHCLGAESFLWSCPMTALGGPDCSHGNTASVICSAKLSILRNCNLSTSSFTFNATYILSKELFCRHDGSLPLKCSQGFHYATTLQFPGERNGNPLQHSYLRNPMDRGAWWAINWTWNNRLVPNRERSISRLYIETRPRCCPSATPAPYCSGEGPTGQKTLPIPLQQTAPPGGRG
ncbi:hypothetical protein FD754_023505, partial [Muntiacus muntjak]